MSVSNHRRRGQSESDKSGSDTTLPASTSSLKSAVVMIASVFAALAVISIIFVRMPTTSVKAPRATDFDSTNGSMLDPSRGTAAAEPINDPMTGLTPAKVQWIAELPEGTHGSPRLFRDDTHCDMIIAYGDERRPIGGAMAIDVATGHARWKITGEDEMFTLPIPMPVRPGGEAPWLIGGRNGQLFEVDAGSGEVMWKFQPSGQEGRRRGYYNFFTGRPLSDVDGDGIEDFLIPNGGDSKRNRYQSRPPGHLLVLSGATGEIIHQMQVPDGRETYLSPLFWDRKDETLVVFGTGGETFPGSLWTVPIESVRAGTLDGVRAMVPNKGSKGAIPPPSFADIDEDGVLDLISASFDGRLVVISGRNLTTLWEFTPDGVQETQCSPTVADFDGDGDLDIAYSTMVGVFPRWTACYLRVFDGQSGNLIWRHLIRGNLSAASPLALDIDGDGKDELFFIHANPDMFRPSSNTKSVSQLQMVHVDEGRIEEIGAIYGFNAGCGWIGDADNDGRLEWYVPLKMDDRTGRLTRVDLEADAPPFIAWGGYLGTQHDGVYGAVRQ